jgi:hypothetical protein
MYQRGLPGAMPEPDQGTIGRLCDWKRQRWTEAELEEWRNGDGLNPNAEVEPRHGMTTPAFPVTNG